MLCKLRFFRLTRAKCGEYTYSSGRGIWPHYKCVYICDRSAYMSIFGCLKRGLGLGVGLEGGLGLDGGWTWVGVGLAWGLGLGLY